MSTQTIERMAVEIEGSGDPVILIHGLGGSANTFQPQMAVFRDRRAVRPELPGSARSKTPEGGIALGGLAEALVRMAGLLGIERAHFVGHSLGTLLCQQIAAGHPRLVRSLALLGALSEPPEAARGALRERATRARAEGMAEIADSVVSASVASAAREESPVAAAFVRESLQRQCPEGYAKTCEALAEARAADAGRIKCPTLLVNGDEDPVAPASVARELGGRIEGARVMILNRCGHWPSVERPLEVNRLLKDFYGSVAR